jgi:hypothetical protein
MTYTPAAPQGASARAWKAMLMLAGKACWSLKHLGLDVDPRFATHVYAPEAELILLPTTTRLLTAMAEADMVMNAARSDALVIRVPDAEARRVELAIGIWKSGENDWHLPMGLWAGGSGVWIVPDPYHRGIRPHCFQITGARLRSARAPWRSRAEERHGRTKADAWMARVMV